jgi:hypothetical protein
MNLLEELQTAATDSSVPIADLLRKALLVASGLNAPDFVKWLKLELAGYGDTPEEDIPTYREVAGVLHTHSPVRGWAPVMPENLQVAEALQPLTRVRVAQPATELETIAKLANAKSRLRIPLSPEVQDLISRGIGRIRQSALMVPQASAAAIVDAIRHSVFTWTLELGNAGIIGTGATFSTNELKKSRSVQINILNIYGDATNAMIQQGTRKSTQSKASTPA